MMILIKRNDDDDDLSKSPPTVRKGRQLFVKMMMRMRFDGFDDDFE